METPTEQLELRKSKALCNSRKYSFMSILKWEASRFFFNDNWKSEAQRLEEVCYIFPVFMNYCRQKLFKLVFFSAVNLKEQLIGSISALSDKITASDFIWWDLFGSFINIDLFATFGWDWT